MMDQIDCNIINNYQSGIPLCDRPFKSMADTLGLSESDVLQRITSLLENGTLTRFGPLYNIEALGGEFTLCAMSVPLNLYDLTTEIVNSFDEVAHNYEREHELNMWFVLATKSQQQTQDVIDKIQDKTGLRVLSMPKIEEFYVGLYLTCEKDQYE